MTAILTIGYQGRSPEDLFADLRAAGAGVLIDVRAVPWSRRAVFTKAALRTATTAAELRYVHLAGLGNPAKTDPTGGPGMANHLASGAGRAALDAAAALLAETGRPIALMCLERDPMHCHRRFIAAALAERTKLPVHHIVAPNPPSARSNPAQGDLFGPR
ncbi:DUF488 domain-containing protein [Roseospira marina]|uniref:DUF488 domain-containing protein n=1 Tax=Roseospira marina TaxID=140057 RepID=A0A5M6IAP2_9PROT|nr:DUF488 domain-containing protein [Roseospira marina]KAA5604795.1 DUF488 domain-containing protein [Roseospira marina]MBB4313484.1 uncharacterized protein (DUF488 family) [Roseospira marina]MBB5086646.1 uncharacterized protein (DUF488 family) [Roseospira marina]